TVSVLSVSQISDELLARNPEYIYVPITEFEKNKERLSFVASRATLVAAFPRIIKDTEEKEALRLAGIARECGVEYASVGNCGHIALAEGLGFTVRGDFGINITNSHALREVRRMGVVSALLSPELTIPRIRDVSKIMETEIIVYGRLPLMICENCVISSQTGSCVCGNRQFLTDRTGAAFPLTKEFGCRTVILNSQKLFLADKRRDYEKLGAAFARLSFTTENPKECVTVLDAYLGKNDFIPSVYTRGLYYRGVE
ncbi:MAG: U32 family peptidase, partial [Oscillospiraceae bacterium]|nr:U32 family peptidase [Oscillospiraceae bacterium]